MTNDSTSPSATSDDVLARMLDEVGRRDAADAPDLAGAIASILAHRLEGTPLPEEVEALVASLDPAAPSAELRP